MWAFIQDEILGMQWLNRLIRQLLTLCGLNMESRIGGSVQFFLYDTIKIMVLLGILILIISYIQSYFPPERSKKILGRYKGIGARIIAALLGTVTPFCSCSSIPLFIGFTSAGLPLGVTFSFLISSPMVDLGSLVLLMSIFGWKVAVIYVVLGLVIAVAGGTLIEKLHLEDQVQDFIRNGKALELPQEALHVKDRLKYAWEQVVSTAKKVFPYVLIGVGIGAVIHNWIRCDHCNDLRHPDVCRHFRHDPDRGGVARQRRTARRSSIFYDGSHHTIAAIHGYAEEGGQGKTPRHIHRNLYRWNYPRGIFL